MNWYYAEAGRQSGPVTESQLLALVAAGRVREETLVWCEGMPEWKPFREVKGGLKTSSRRPEPAISAGEAASGQAACTECGRLYPENSMTVVRGMHVCGNCLPVFRQKVKEGQAVKAGLDYAGFGIRLAAMFLDSIVFFFVYLVFLVIALPHFGDEARPMGPLQSIIMLYGAYIAYYVIFHGRYGATPGKMAVSIKVVRPDGSPITYSRAFGRVLAEIGSGFTFLTGYLLAAFDREKRALHDFIAHTRVINTQVRF